jgi:hypothetical protein
LEWDDGNDQGVDEKIREDTCVRYWVSSKCTNAPPGAETYRALQLFKKFQVQPPILGNAQSKCAPNVTNPSEDLQRRPQGSFLGVPFEPFPSAMVFWVVMLRGRVQSCIVNGGSFYTSRQGRQKCSKPAAAYRAKVERENGRSSKGLTTYAGVEVAQEKPGGFLLAGRVCLIIWIIPSCALGSVIPHRVNQDHARTPIGRGAIRGTDG